MLSWHSVSGRHLRGHFWRGSRIFFDLSPTWNMFLSFPSFQKALFHSFWPREPEVVLIQCHHVASLPTSPLWSNSWMMIRLPCSKSIYHSITRHSLLLLAKHHVIPCMHVMYQNFQMREICFLTKLSSYTLLPKPWDMSLSHCILEYVMYKLAEVFIIMCPLQLSCHISLKLDLVFEFGLRWHCSAPWDLYFVFLFHTFSCTVEWDIWIGSDTFRIGFRVYVCMAWGRVWFAGHLWLVGTLFCPLVT